MIISIGNDHSGTDYKISILDFLETKKIDVINHGTNSFDSVDYPDFAHLVAKDVNDKKSNFGILICGSGNGVAMTANKYKDVRAGLCWTSEIASLVRQHNDANILVIPARFTNINQAKDIVKVFLEVKFEGGRHLNRVNKICN